MFATLFKPKTSLAALILRLGLAGIFVVHGYIKLYVTIPLIPEMSLPTQRAVGWAELACGLVLAVGLFSRLAAVGIIGLQAGAIALVSGKYALKVLDATARGSDYLRVGPEYNLVLIAMALSVVVLGSGAFSLDHLLVCRWHRKPAAAAPGPTPAPTPA